MFARLTRLFPLLFCLALVLTSVPASMNTVAPVAAQGGEALDPGHWPQEHITLAANASGNLSAAWEDSHHAKFPASASPIAPTDIYADQCTQPPLWRIEVRPSNVTLRPGEQQQFTAIGYDSHDNPVPITPLWTTNDPTGTITQDGLYTAGTQPGYYTVVATVEDYGRLVEGTAIVQVLGPPTPTPTPTPTPIPPVQAWVDANGVLHIVLQGHADATVTVKDGNVLVNGQPVGDPPAKAADIKGINVQGGDGANTIDLKEVVRTDFTSLEDGKVVVSAGGGDDTVYGSLWFGNVILGEKGSDRLYGGSRTDYISGGLPDENDGDLIDGGLFGHDFLYGGGGNDVMYSGEGNDNVDGGPGNDIVWTAGGDDTINTGEGDDTIQCLPFPPAEPPPAILSGQGSDAAGDRLASVATLSDEGGDDTIDFSAVTTGITIDLDLQNADQVVDTAGNIVRLEGQFENVVGSDFDDVLSVDPLAVPRRLDGGLHAAGDTLNFDPHGAWVADDGQTITAAGYAPVTYTGFETVNGTQPCPALSPGASWEQIFTVPGSYPYFDPYNPAHTGRVVVGTAGQSWPERSRRAATLSYGVVPISITEAGFDPLLVTIAISDTVRWTNHGMTTHAIRGGEPSAATPIPTPTATPTATATPTPTPTAMPTATPTPTNTPTPTATVKPGISIYLPVLLKGWPGAPTPTPTSTPTATLFPLPCLACGGEQ